MVSLNQNRTFAFDVMWSYVCLALAAIGGIILNVTLVYLFDAAALGIFGFAYAFLVISGQLASCGIQYSSLRQAAISSQGEMGTMLVAALTSALATTIVVVSIEITASPLIVELTNINFQDGFLWVVAAVVPFSINKIYLATINGARRIRTLYSIQVLRVFLLLAFVLVIDLLGHSGAYVIRGFLFTEIIIFAVCSLSCWRYLKLPRNRIRLSAINHLKFGFRSLVTGLSVEAHTRLDILVLGFYTNETNLGIYTFVAFIAEGLLQVIAIIRNNVNPLLALYFHQVDRSNLTKLIHNTKNFGFLVFAATGITVIAGYPWLITLLGFEQFQDAWILLTILVVTQVLLAPFMALDHIITQYGRPEVSSVIFLLGALTSLGLNLLTIPIYGLYGAAISTAISWIAFVVYLIIACRITTGINLISNSYVKVT